MRIKLTVKCLIMNIPCDLSLDNYCPRYDSMQSDTEELIVFPICPIGQWGARKSIATECNIQALGEEQRHNEFHRSTESKKRRWRYTPDGRLPVPWSCNLESASGSRRSARRRQHHDNSCSSSDRRLVSHPQCAAVRLQFDRKSQASGDCKQDHSDSVVCLRANYITWTTGRMRQPSSIRKMSNDSNQDDREKKQRDRASTTEESTATQTEKGKRSCHRNITNASNMKLDWANKLSSWRIKQSNLMPMTVRAFLSLLININTNLHTTKSSNCAAVSWRSLRNAIQ